MSDSDDPKRPGLDGRPEPFFQDIEGVERLASIIGVPETLYLLRRNIHLQRGKLESSDVACLYDDYYHAFVESHPSIKEVGGYSINYYTQFAYEHIARAENLGKRVLDVGCGSGELALALAASGLDVLGVDFDAKAIRRANANRERGTITGRARFETRDARDIDEHFDFIIFSDVVEHLAPGELLSVLRRCRELLNPGGELVIHTPNGNIDPGLDHAPVHRLAVRAYWGLGHLLKPPGRDALIGAYYTQVHINVMKPEELEAILYEAGFSEIDTQYRNPKRSLFRKAIARARLSADLAVIAKP